MQLRTTLTSILLIATILSGCLGSDDEPVTVPIDSAAPLSAWLHDLSEPIPGLATVTEQYRTFVEGPLGESSVELDTWIIRPDVAEPVPLVLEVTPYYTSGEPASRGRVGIELIERGYAVGVSSVRGTGSSTGCFTQGGVTEAKDTAAVIEHMASMPWSSGNVGLIGVSYPGTTPQDVWVEAPPSLKTIVPISGISDLYKYNFINGVPIEIQGLAFNAYYWYYVGLGGTLGGVPGAVGYTNDPTNVPGAVAGEACAEQVDVQEGGASSTADGNKDAYWQERDFLAEYMADDREVERASVFYIHGLQDWNVKTHNMEDWLDALWDSGVPMKVWLGQWGHAWPASSSVATECNYNNQTDRGGSCRADWWNQTMVAWFDYFLKGVDTGIMDAPAAQIQNDDGVWRGEDIWPPRDATNLELFFAAESLIAEGPGSGTASYTIAPADAPVPNSVDRIWFVSEPLKSNITISGLPNFQATVTSDGARATLVMSLGERDDAGVDRWVNHGVLSLNHAMDLSNGDLDISGKQLAIDLDMFPQDDVLHEGNRIVLTIGGDVAGGPGPAIVPMNDLGQITIDLATAKLTLPIDESLNFELVQPYANWEETQN